MPKLSVLVPAYNEEDNITNTLEALTGYLDKETNLDYEVIVVNDGSRDKTAKKAGSVDHPAIKVVDYQTNMGKGYAVRTAFDHSSGDLVAFFDAGLDFYPAHITEFIKYMKANNVDIVVGSKRHPLSQVDYPLKRRAISLMGQIVFRTLFHLQVRDTQVGMKLFKRKVLADVMPRALVKQFAFDIELLALAERYGYTITEAPVKMNYNFSTSSVNWKAIQNSLWDTAAVFYRMKILHYYDKPAKEREKIVARLQQKYAKRKK